MGCNNCSERKMCVEIGDKCAESDPNGIDQHAPGAKLDAGKPDVGLLFESFPRALMMKAEVSTYGAKKYTRMGWVKVENGVVRYLAAGGRHILKHFSEGFLDPESGFPHLAHAGWCIDAALELILRDKHE